jgi:hypothetical protein
MGYLGGYYYGSGQPEKKRWRYPGVPIPFRLQHRYTNNPLPEQK